MRDGCEAGQHDWRRTETETEYGFIYKCRTCGEREVEP